MFASIAALALSACTQATSPEQVASENAGADSKAKSSASKPAAGSAETEPTGEPAWQQVSTDALSDSAKARLEEAKKAKQMLGSMLVKELTAAVEGGNFARGVEVCKEAAPKVADQVSEQYDVAVGRTSFKVRNPDNAPRAWAEPYVEERVKEDVVLMGPKDTLAYLSPIKTAAVCLNCHGTAEQIPEDVQQMIAEAYPQDEATGFAEGDLRGWFWVEVAER